MHILYVTPEVWPFARVGGLAEVSHDLPLALGAMGHTVDVVTPKCRLAPELEEQLERQSLDLEVPVSWRRHRAEVFSLKTGPGVTLHLVCHDHLFDREGLYGNAYGDYEDNAERFIFFSRATVELGLALGQKIDAVHVHDWTTGLVPLYLKSLYADQPLLAEAGTLMTVHNLGSQGVFWHYDMPLTGLGWEYFTPEAIEFYGKINFLKAGLVYADMVSTVSPNYLEEILTLESGCGLEGVLASRRERLAAVINGVDYKVWDPATDPHLAANYSPADLGPKAVCKASLRKEFGLPVDSTRPLAAFVGRLVDRRGMDIFLQGLEPMLERGLDLVIMGYGEDHYHTTLQELGRRHPENLGVAVGYEMETAHRVMAGADMLLMPSRYEPCGLHQLQAMRYGTVPVVRSTGGLVDTVADHTPANPGLGFRFGPYEAPAMLAALDRALAAYGDPPAWRGLVLRCMAQDYSWGKAAAQYEDLYRRAKTLRLQD
jgi:starch synthase